MKPGIYYDLPEDQYHLDPCEAPSLSAGIAKVLLSKSPRHAWQAHPRLNPNYTDTNKERFDIGKAAHSLILHDPRDFVIVDAEDWRTKDAKERRETAYAEKKTPLLRKHWDSVNAMVEAAEEQLEQHECHNAFAAGKSEVTLIWQEGDVWCRCRVDHIAENGVDFYDYKTTDSSANPASAERLFYGLGYDLTHAFYRRGIRAVMGIENPNYKFVVQETDEPYALSVIGLAPEASDVADRKAAEAIRLWGECIKSGKWPAYPNRIAYIGMPVWAEKEWLERENRELIAKDSGQGEFANAINY